MTYLVDPSITRAWWSELLNDNDRLIKWLQKLENTEIDGYSDNFEANASWNPTGHRAIEMFFIATARDELRHSRILKSLLKERGYPVVTPMNSQSLFWTKMDEYVFDLKTCCAVFYYGERLAAERFMIISENKETPSDIMNFIYSALPDETYHAEGFKKLAGEEAIEYMKTPFDSVMSQLLKGRT